MQRIICIILTSIFYISFAEANLNAISNSSKNTEISVYKYITPTSSIQDEKQAMQAMLKQNNIQVLSIYFGYDGLIYDLPKDFNMDTSSNLHLIHQGGILIITIKESDWSKLSDVNLNFSLCSDLQKQGGACNIFYYSHLYPQFTHKSYVSVYKYSNQIQCQPQSGNNIHEVEQTLIKKNIVVYQSFEGFSGEPFLLQCGNKTNQILIYLIEKSKLGIAISLGFNECAWLKNNNYDCYRFTK